MISPWLPVDIGGKTSHRLKIRSGHGLFTEPAHSHKRVAKKRVSAYLYASNPHQSGPLVYAAAGIWEPDVTGLLEGEKR